MNKEFLKELESSFDSFERIDELQEIILIGRKEAIRRIKIETDG